MIELWSCPADETWTQFILNRSIPEREALIRHLDTCQYCQVFVEAKRRELDQLAAGWAAFKRPNIVHLTPLAHSFEGEAESGVLAAQGEDEKGEFEALALVSPEQDMLLRVVRDHHDGTLWLYLLAEEPAQYRNVILKPFGGEQEYITDDEGRVNLGIREWPGPEELTAEVHLPTATFRLDPIGEEEFGIRPVIIESPGGERIEVVYEGDCRNRRLRIRLLESHALDESIPLKMAIRTPEAPGVLHLQEITGQQAIFDGVETKHQLEIYLFQ